MTMLITLSPMISSRSESLTRLHKNNNKWENLLMMKKFLKLIAGSTIIFFSSFLLADDHARSYFVETIPMSLVGESNLEDLLNTKEPFKAWMENGGTKYNVVLMVPWAVDKSAAGSQTDWDVIWTGFSPTVQDYSETMEYYLSKGEEIDSIYNGMRSFNTRSMAMGRTIFQGTAPSGKTGVALFRTCSLNKNKTIENAESAMIGMASALKKAGSQGSSHIWMPGPGSTQAQQGTFLSVRTFPSISAWSESFAAYGNGDFSKEERAARATSDCSPMRMYLTYPHYIVAAN